MRRLFIAMLLACACCTPLRAQTVAQISGVVQDSSNAVIPGAQVTITNVDTSAARVVETGGDGAYTIKNLLPGPYRLQVTATGFATYSQTGIVLQVGSSSQINVSLKIGTVSDQVEVSANAAMVETASNSVGQVIDEQRVVDLPLNGRNAADLIVLSGAAVQYVSGAGTSGQGQGLVNTLSYPTVNAVSIAGGQSNATNYLLDGGVHIDPRTNVGLPMPFPDALQEFKVETSTVPANYGSRPGGSINVVTKSGTNSLHGTVFEFIRNGRVNARNFFAATRDSLKRNQYGGLVGGPIVKDKLFFMVGFQGTNVRTAPATSQSFVPTAAVLQGDFRTILAPPCQSKQVNLNAASGAVNNVMSPNSFNAVALKFTALYPVATDPCGLVKYALPTPNNEYQGIVRTDWQRNMKDTIFFRYYTTDYNAPASLTPGNLLTSVGGNTGRISSFNLGDTYLLNSKMINSFRFAPTRSVTRRTAPDGLVTLRQLGSNVYAKVPAGGNGTGVSGYLAGGAAAPADIVMNIFGINDDVSMNLGSHQLALGFNLTYSQMNSFNNFQGNGSFVFNGQITGNALADFMIGKGTSFTQANGQYGKDRQKAPSLYFQDNWRVSPKLSINAGIRWDPFFPQSNELKYVNIFDMSRFLTNQKSTVFVNAPAGLTFPGDPGYPGLSTSNPRKANFAPRLGLVWNPRGNGQEAIRASYGVFYDTSFLWISQHIVLNPPFGNSITVNNVDLSDPWKNYAGGNPFPKAPNPPSTYPFPAAGVYTTIPEHVKSTYVQQWNLSFQKQVGTDWLFSASYMGNKTTHMWLGRELNPSVYIPGNCAPGQYGLTVAGPCSSTATVQGRRLFNTLNPSSGTYYGSLMVVDDSGNASYNGLLLSANRRMSKHISAMANFTWSHCLNNGEVNQDIVNAYQNPSNRKAEWANCATDRRRIMNLSFVAQAPKFASKWMQHFAGDWQLSGIFAYQAGGWTTPQDGTDVSWTANWSASTGQTLDRPDVVGNVNLANPTYNQWFNTAAFAKQAAGTFGNATRDSILGPSNWNVDTALFKNFHIREGLTCNLRFEAFNTFNHTRFNAPTAMLNSNNYGKITTARDPRILQAALKFMF